MICGCLFDQGGIECICGKIDSWAKFDWYKKWKTHGYCTTSKIKTFEKYFVISKPFLLAAPVINALREGKWNLSKVK
jgi:hypothetical protein